MSNFSKEVKTASSKAWGFIPEPVRGAFYILGAAGIVYGLYRVYTKITTPDVTENAKDELSKLAKAGVKPTLSDVQIQSISSRIKSAAAGQNILGTDEQAIYNAFSQLRNDADFNKLVIEFGEERKSFSFSKTDLFGWIVDELNESEIGKLNTILRQRAVTYKF